MPPKPAAMPTPEQLEWAACELGAIIHYDINVFEPEYEFRAQRGYSPDPVRFAPRALDCEQWVRICAETGLKYAVLVAKHCSGFCLWPTKAYPYSVAQSSYQGDIVGEFIAACRKYGVKPGLYYSASCNAYCNVDNPGRVLSGGAEAQRAYNAIVEMQLEELWGNYGELFEIWFDGGCLPVEQGGPDIISRLNRLQPGAVVFQGPESARSLLRWVGNEDGVAPEDCWSTTKTAGDSYDGTFPVDSLTGHPDGPIWAPGESDVPLRHHDAFGGGWFWRKDEDDLVHTPEHFLDLYFRSVGRNTNMLIGLVVDDQGLIPARDVEALRGLKACIDATFAHPIAQAWGGPSLTLSTAGESIGAVALREDIAQGHRVRQWALWGHRGDARELIHRAHCIGHKRLLRLDGVWFDAVTLEIEEGNGEVAMEVYGGIS